MTTTHQILHLMPTLNTTKKRMEIAITTKINETMTNSIATLWLKYMEPEVLAMMQVTVKVKMRANQAIVITRAQMTIQQCSVVLSMEARQRR